MIRVLAVVTGLWLIIAPQLCAEMPGPERSSSSQWIKGWPAGVTRVEIPCSDGETQPAMWYAPLNPKQEPRPLLVGLHTWSSHYASSGGDAVYAEWCIQQGWAFVHPDFRGPNWTPLAMGSDRAVQDIVEAVAWARRKTAIDGNRIYLVGVSGGGHMALLMAGRHPELWAGVSAWCGISDIAQWHAEHQKDGRSDNYARNIEAALGHVPALGDPEALQRSPLKWLKGAEGVALDINAGVHDGRSGSVPFMHSLRAFNAVVQAADGLPEGEIRAFYQSGKRPANWPATTTDPTYGHRVPVFRKAAGNTRVTVFEGGHEIVHQAALNWLAAQRRGRPAVWQVNNFIPLGEAASDSGK